VVELDRDWTSQDWPRFSIGEQCPRAQRPRAAPGLVAGSAYGYFLNAKSEITFLLPLEHGCDIDPARDTVFLAGDFNDWQVAVGQDAWRMSPAELDGERVLLWTGEAARFLATEGLRFKFVTGEHQWLLPPGDAPNVVRDDKGNLNRFIDPHRSGWHLWRFTLAMPLDLAEPRGVSWAEAPGATQAPFSRGVPLVPGNFFYELETQLPLGALVRDGATVFRLFAPRARSVTLFLTNDSWRKTTRSNFHSARRSDADGAAGVWEISLNRNLHQWFYWYIVDGVREGPGKFVPELRVLDPYALACVGREGPGIVLDPRVGGAGAPRFSHARVARPHHR